MARVAGCPQCSHELLVPDEADGEAWAKCPQCRSFFQVREAASREVPAALLVDAAPNDANEAKPRSATTLSDFSSSATLSDSAGDDLAGRGADTLSGETVVIPFEPDQTSDELSAAANRIDEWFRSAKEAVDTSASPADEAEFTADEPATDARSSGMTTNATVFFDPDALGNSERGADFDLEESPGPTPAAWNDASEMGKRPAEAESPRVNEFAPVYDEAADAAAPARDMENTAEEATKDTKSTGMTTNATVFFDSDALGDTERGADFDLEESPEPSPAWDDTGELLTKVESPLANEFAPTDDEAAQSEQGLGDAQPAFAFPTEFTPESAIARGARRRKRSPVRLLVMILLGGFVGVAGGYYALLWLRGPSLDFLHVAQHLPQAMLPPSFKSGEQQLAARTPRTPSTPAAVDTPRSNEPDEPAALATDAPADTADKTPEMQASYEEPAAEPATAQDDRYAIGASEPAPPEVQPLETDAAAGTGLTPSPEDVTASAPPADDARVANAPTFTAEELSAALEEAKKAQPALVSGNLADSKDVARAKGYSYSMLADLAQKAAFVDASAPSETTPLQQAAEELFRQTLSDTHTRSDVALILPKWLASRNRKHGGVFFAASMTGQENKGSVTECRAELDNGQWIAALLPAATAERLDESSGPMAVVGWVVDGPAEQVSGYTGDAPQAIWVSKLIALE